jgi:hypothetical protein
MNNEKEEPANRAYDEVMSEILSYSRTLKKEKNLMLFIRGLQYSGPDKVYDGKIHIVTTGYLANMNIPIDEARVLLYSVADGLLERLNSLGHLQDCYANYPLNYGNLDFCLSFSSSDKKNLKKNDTSSVNIKRSKTFYEIVENPAGTPPTHRKMSDDVYILEKSSTRTRSLILPVEKDRALLNAQNTAYPEIQSQAVASSPPELVNP